MDKIKNNLPKNKVNNLFFVPKNQNKKIEKVD